MDEMKCTSCAVIDQEWSSFGCSKRVAQKVSDIPTSNDDSLVAERCAFIWNDSSVEQRLRQASGKIPQELIAVAQMMPDVEDPTLVTQRETVVMPDNALSISRGFRRSGENEDPNSKPLKKCETPCAKMKPFSARDASPTSVFESIETVLQSP